MNFNINNWVKIELTPEGWLCWLDHVNEPYELYKKNGYKPGKMGPFKLTLPKLKKQAKSYNVKKGNWVSFQMWQVMQIFGPKMYLGGPILFHPTIKIDI